METAFRKPGYRNTDAAMAVLRESVARFGIRQVVVASTRGGTGLEAAEMFEGSKTKVVIVTHNVGFKKPGTLEMYDETRRKIEELGARVLTGTMPFRSIGTAIREQQAYSQQDLIANTLRLLGQGTKVCVEIVLMASDAGLITPEDCLAVAGTARGADTVALIKPAPSNRLFELKIRRILAKPSNW